MFSKSCEYGLRAIIYIAQQSQKNLKVSLTTVATEIDSPQAFTSKILQQLIKNNVINSIKGPKGGFYIDPDNMNIKLSDIVQIIDGDKLLIGCGLGLKNCSDTSPCPLHFKFIEIRTQIKTLLENTNLDMLVNEMNSDLYFLKH